MRAVHGPNVARRLGNIQSRSGNVKWRSASPAQDHFHRFGPQEARLGHSDDHDLAAQCLVQMAPSPGGCRPSQAYPSMMITWGTSVSDFRTAKMHGNSRR